MTTDLVNDALLPLTMARQLVEQQGGVFKVRSEAENGTLVSFTFLTRLPEVRQQERTLPTEARELDPASIFEGLKFLFVEDNIMSQRVGKAMIENWGATVALAESGKAALNLLQETRFDVILMDLKMPDLSGIETTVMIRNDLKLTTPILAMTVSETQTKREACIKAGMDDYILKPLNSNTLFTKLTKLLNIADNKTTERLTNIEYVKSITNNDSALMREVLEIYVTRTPALIQEIDQNIAEGKYTLAQGNIHYLKNSVGLLGADTLFHTLATIEEKLNNVPPTPETLQLIKNMKEVVEESLQETNEELKLL